MKLKRSEASGLCQVGKHSVAAKKSTGKSAKMHMDPPISG
jgi:hypothetical protein